MTAYQQGSYPAFEELYMRHAGRVFGYLKNHLFDAVEAEDLMQVTFLRLHSSRAKYDPGFPFLPWLFAICRNGLIDRQRKKKVIYASQEILETRAAPTADMEGEELRNTEKALSEYLGQLSMEQKELLRLRFEEGLSFEEISKRMGLSSPTLRKRVSRTIDKLRESFRSKVRRAGEV
jgi:RNA polymerase sigma factor (sigma-70 family)